MILFTPNVSGDFTLIFLPKNRRAMNVKNAKLVVLNDLILSFTLLCCWPALVNLFSILYKFSCPTNSALTVSNFATSPIDGSLGTT